MIRGSSFVLRPLRESDLDAFLAGLNNLESRGDYLVHRIISEVPFKKEFRETGLWTDEGGRLVLVDAEERLLGTIGFFRPGHYLDALELGYHIFDTAQRGRGLISEAAVLLVDWLFRTKKIDRLQLTLMQGNAASRRVAEKAGFQREGVLRSAVFHAGASHDLELWALLRSEWAARRAGAPA